MVIVIDEFTNDDIDLIRTVKLVTSQFQEETTLDTVINFNAETKVIPERIAFILMSVSPLDSEEMIQRFLTIDVPNDNQYLEDINRKQKGREGKLPTKNRQPDFDTQVCRCIYCILNIFVCDIRIPFANIIEWNDIEHTRNWELFADLIRCSAYYNIPNREYFHKPENNEVGSFLATYEDYENAVEIYNKLSDNNVTKLSNNELKIINVLMEARKRDIEAKRTSGTTAEDVKLVEAREDEITTFGEMYISGVLSIKDLSNAVGVGENTIRNMLNGPKKNGGLLARICGLHSAMVSEKVSDQTIHKTRVWYDGPDHIILNVPKVPRDMCDTETDRFKEDWINKWEEEDQKMESVT